MSKRRVKTSAPQVDHLLGSTNADWVAEEIKTLNEGALKATKTRSTARAFLRKHGFLTKSGKLTKVYQG